MRIRALTPSDVPQYRELMLEAYTLAADAFTTTAEERAAEPESWWIRRIADPKGLSAAFGALDGNDLVGTVAIEYSAKPKTRHAASIVGMYVRDAVRGRGIGQELVSAAIQHAAQRPGVEVVTLTVTEGNERAIRLYQSAGFQAWGVQPMAIATSSGYKGKVHMWRKLSGRAPAQIAASPAHPMTPRLTVLTLGVDDLERAVAFYRDGLGWPTQGIVGQEFAHGAVAFFDLQPGLRLALWARADLAHDAGLPQGPASPTESSLGHNVTSAAEVDAAMAAAARAGARIVKPAAPTFWGGYAGYFQDPDGHLWEVVWNPAWTPA